jgi:hypothetical protein
MDTEATSPLSSVTLPLDTALYWFVMRIEWEPHSSQDACWFHAARSGCWCRAFLCKDRPAEMRWCSSSSVWRAPAASSVQTLCCPSFVLCPPCFRAKSLSLVYPSLLGCDAGSLLLCFVAFWRKTVPSSPRRPFGHRQKPIWSESSRKPLWKPKLPHCCMLKCNSSWSFTR